MTDTEQTAYNAGRADGIRVGYRRAATLVREEAALAGPALAQSALRHAASLLDARAATGRPEEAPTPEIRT